ncbi:MAG: transposase [Thermoplasmata archaeon]
MTKHFVKLHVAIDDEGITHAVSITDGEISETVVLPYLVCDIDFPPDIIRADAGYLSKDKVQLITDLGAALFVKLKRQPELLSMGRPAWKHMLLRHREDPEGLANEYNLRWRHEAFFSKLKRRFGPPKSRNRMMRCREVWMRILILNILAVAGEQVEEER